jgi:hypothetical protein
MKNPEHDPDLERLAAATDGLAPGAGFADAVMQAVERDLEPHALDEALARISAATDGLVPGEGFAGAVMSAVERIEIAPASEVAPPSVLGGVARHGRWALVGALAVAAACAGLAVREATEFDDAVVALDLPELE